MNKAGNLAFAGLLAAVVFGAAPAHADTYTLTLSGEYNFTFDLPSNPTVTSYFSGLEFSTVPTGGDIPAGTSLSFGTSADGGGLGFYSSGPSFYLDGYSPANVQLFSGDVSSPQLTLGTYTLIDPIYIPGQPRQFDQLTIADDVSTTPLPATLPLFAGGLGFVGYLARRRKRSGKQALLLRS